MMQSANQPAARQFRQDVPHAVVGLAWSWSVIECQQAPRDALNQEEEYGHAADDLVPAAGGRNLFVKETPDGGFNPRPLTRG